MKLLIITEHLDQFGGVCSSIINVSNALSKFIDIDVITREKNVRKNVKFTLDENVGFFSFGSKKNSEMNFITKLVNWVEFGFYLRKLSRDYDFFYSNGMVLNIISLIFLCDKKVIVCDHSNFNFNNRWLRLIRFFIYRTSYKVLALTTDSEIEFKKIKCSTAIIPNSIDCSQRSTFNTNKRAIIVGRLDNNKQVDHAIKAWIKNFKNESEWELLIYGEGKNKNELLNLANGRRDIVFKGNEEDKSIIYNCSFIILTSISEGLPMVLLEAQSYGIPIVSYDCSSGPSDIVINGSGLLVKANDLDGLTNSIKKVTNNDDLLKEMSISAINNRYRYSHENITNKWLDVLNCRR